MNLALTVLDGPLRGQILSLQNELVLSGPYFSDEEMGNQHAVITLDSNLSWNIRTLEAFKLRVGLAESAQISLILGLVFHLGQTGFKVIEKPRLQLGGWESALMDWVGKQNWTEQKTDFFFFLYPVRMTFLSGPQAGEFFTISYGPRTMGFNSFDLNIKDPSQPKEIVRFYQIGETAYVENLAGGLLSDKVLVNKNRFDHHAIAGGEQLQFGSHVIEFSILR